MSILVTGGVGFIGSNFVLDWLIQSDELVINLDRLTYAGNIENLQSLDGDHRHVFVQGDIGDSALVADLLAQQEAGQAGEVYNIGGWNEKPNLEIVHTVWALLDEPSPRADGKPYKEQITYVADRPGHDRRYAIDARKLESELGWMPDETFETGTSPDGLGQAFIIGNDPSALVLGDMDTGTHESLLDASQFIATLENRQGIKVACPEEIAYRQGWINSAQLEALAPPLTKNGYGQYLLRILKENVF